MSTRFIGNGNGLVIRCNHGDVAMGERQAVDDAGKPAVDEAGCPVYERHWPSKCDEKLVTGQILRSGIRHYAGTQKWLSVKVDGRLRDFCSKHGPERKAWLKTRAAERKEAETRKKTEREAKKAAKRAAWLAKLAEWKRKREEKAARSAAWQAKRAAKASAGAAA